MCIFARALAAHVQKRMEAVGTVPANSEESDLGVTSRVYFDNVTLTAQKSCQHNYKFDCSERNGYNIPQ